MDAKLVSILSDIQALAERRGWPEVTVAINDLLSSAASPTILLASARGVNATPIRRWVEEAATGKVEVCGLEELAHNRLTALSAGKIIAVFECGRLLEADAVEAVAGALFCRPLSSYAIVLSNAEVVTDEEDLNLVERGTWRLLVPDATPDWAGQELLEHQCYLWGMDEVGEFLQARVERDKDALTTWLHAPLENAQELARHQVLSVINLVEEYVEKNKVSEPSAPSRAEHIVETRESLVQLRRRLIRRLDADAASNRRQLTASLQTLEQDLLQDLLPYLEQHLSLSVSITEATLRRILTEYIIERVSLWKHHTEALIRSRSEEIRTDTDGLLRIMDWSLINDVAARQGKKEIYPDALLQEWADDLEVGSVVRTDVQSARQPSRKRAVTLSGVMQAAAAAATLTVTATVFGLVPVGLVAAVLGAIMVNRHKEQSLRECETYGRAVIKAIIRTAIASVQGGAQPAIAKLRQKVFDELKAVEALLDRTLDEARQPPKAVQADPDSALLDTCRREILAVG